MTTAIRTIEQAIEAAPVGTSGLVCEPWSPGEPCGVAADWAQASSPLQILGKGGWSYDEHGRQVADFCHRTRDALEAILCEALIMSGEDHAEAESEAIALAADATKF